MRMDDYFGGSLKGFRIESLLDYSLDPVIRDTM